MDLRSAKSSQGEEHDAICHNLRQKIAFLLPVGSEYTIGFIQQHENDSDFCWKAISAFPQSIRWLNMDTAWGTVHMAWFVFERGYAGEVIREKIPFRRNPFV